MNNMNNMNNIYNGSSGGGGGGSSTTGQQQTIKIKEKQRSGSGCVVQPCLVDCSTVSLLLSAHTSEHQPIIVVQHRRELEGDTRDIMAYWSLVILGVAGYRREYCMGAKLIPNQKLWQTYLSLQRIVSYLAHNQWHSIRPIYYNESTDQYAMMTPMTNML